MDKWSLEKLTVQGPVEKELLSKDIAAEKQGQLKRLFPVVNTDGKIDLEKLRRVMCDWASQVVSVMASLGPARPNT